MSTVASRFATPPFKLQSIDCLPTDVLSIIFTCHVTSCITYNEPAGEDRLSSSTRDALWFAYTHVCRRWRDIALQSPLLWTAITKDVPASWIHVFFDRSGSQSLTIHVLVDKFDKSGALSTVFKEMYRVRELVIEFYDMESSAEYPDAVEDILAGPAPLLEVFKTGDADNWHTYWRVEEELFDDQAPLLHTVVTLRRFRLGGTCSALRTIRHLDADWQCTVTEIAPFLVNSPNIQTIKYSMGMVPDSEEDITDALQKEGIDVGQVQFPVALSHLTRLHVDNCNVPDLLRLYELFVIPPSVRWNINFEHLEHVRNTAWLQCLDLLTKHLHHRLASDITGPLHHLHLSLGHRCFRMSGWTTGVLPDDWTRSQKPPHTHVGAEFNFGFTFSERSFDDYPHRGPPKYVPFVEINDLVPRLPLSNVRSVWFSTDRGLLENHPDIASCCYRPKSWREILLQLPKLTIMRLSHSVIFGVLGAMAYDGDLYQLELPDLTELIVANDDSVKSFSSKLTEVTRRLYNFVRMRYLVGRPLHILRTDLCQTICPSKAMTEAFVAMVDVGVYCTMCKRKTFRGKVPEFHPY